METSETQPFIDAEMQALRRRQRELFHLLPADVREPLLPAVSVALPPDECLLIERALRERVDALLAESKLLDAYLERVRRHRFASAVGDFVEGRWLELAGDAATAMEHEVNAAKEVSHSTVVSATDEEWKALARIVPLMAWADALTTRNTANMGELATAAK
jgi:hypothetical protein